MNVTSGKADDTQPRQESELNLPLQSGLDSKRKWRMSQLLPGAAPQLFLAHKTRPPTQSILAPDNPHFPQSLASPLRP